MRILIAFIALLSATVKADALYPYAVIAFGYKLQEPDYVIYDGEKLNIDFGNKDTAIFEVGFETNYPISFGIKHDSQWSNGWPANEDPEYYKTEIFVKYKIGGK